MKALRRGWVGLSLGLVLAAAPADAARIEGVEFRDQLSLGEEVLELRGTALLRYRIVFRAYVAALYLPPEVSSDEPLADVPRRLEIEYFWSIPAEGFARATLEGVERNVDPATWRRLRPKIEQFNRLYTDVDPGDRYQLTYRPDVGTELALNGERRGLVGGADFARVLFSIWLGPAPFDRSLKQQLLGRGRE